MPVVEEFQEPPGPLELVAGLEYAHEKLIRIAISAHKSPSEESLQAVFESIQDLRNASAFLYSENFFRESENDMLISAAVGAMVNSGDELSEKSLELLPNFDDPTRFFEGLREGLVPALHSGDMSGFIIGPNGNEPSADVDTSFEAVGEKVMDHIVGIYKTIIDKFEYTFLNSKTVSEYLNRQLDVLEKRAARIELIKKFGFTAAAAFAGGLLANEVNKRR